MKKIIFAVLTTTTLLTGCASNLGGDVYSRADARQVQQVELGSIISLRVVRIEGTKTPIGAITGAAVGGIAGSAIGGGTGSYVAAILGAVGGGLAGGFGEELLTRSNGVEITYRMDNGGVRSVVQEIQEREIFRVGDRIRIMNLRGQLRVAKY